MRVLAFSRRGPREPHVSISTELCPRIALSDNVTEGLRLAAVHDQSNGAPGVADGGVPGMGTGEVKVLHGAC